MNQPFEIIRTDNHTPANKRPFRILVDGKILRNKNNEPHKFFSLSQAAAFAQKAGV